MDKIKNIFYARLYSACKMYDVSFHTKMEEDSFIQSKWELFKDYIFQYIKNRMDKNNCTNQEMYDFFDNISNDFKNDIISCAIFDNRKMIFGK